MSNPARLMGKRTVGNWRAFIGAFKRSFAPLAMVKRELYSFGRAHPGLVGGGRYGRAKTVKTVDLRSFST
jgi:hypothetical protein